MKIYKDNQLYFETTDPSEIKGLLTSLINNLQKNYFTSAETMSRIAAARSLYVVASMPASPSKNTIYYVGTANPYDVKLVDSDGTIADLGPSTLDLTGYEKTSNKTLNITSASTDTQYPSAKAVYDYSAPINANGVRVENIRDWNINKAIFNFSNQDVPTGSRQVESRYFMQVSLQDPINTSHNLFGYVVTEQSLVSPYQVRIIQTFTSTFHNNSSGMEGKYQKVFRRVGVITSSNASILFNPLTNISEIVWNVWYPLEYPDQTVALGNGVSNGNVGYVVRGGLMYVKFNSIKFNAATASNITVGIPWLQGRIAPIFNSEYNWGILTSTTAVSSNIPAIAMIGVSANTDYNMYCWLTNSTSVNFWGQLIIPLGY